MTHRVKKNLPLIKALTTCKHRDQRQFLKVADPEIIHSICDIALNVLKGRVPIKPGLKKKLSKHKNVLRRLVKPKQSLKTKRQLLVSQKGGGPFGALIKLLANALL